MLSPIQLLRLKQAAHDAVVCEIVTRLPAELTVAQWALESGWGAHQPGDNCFGIKVYEGCFGSQGLETTEVVDGIASKVMQNFATFQTLAACFQKHADLITGGRPYSAVWEAFLVARNTDALIRGVAPIYATDPSYSQKLLGIIGMPEVARSIGEFRDATQSGPETGPAPPALSV